LPCERDSVASGVANRGGSTTRGGWGHDHQQLRARLDPLVRAGGVLCVYCGEPIVGDWDLCHSDDRRSYIGCAHPFCNRREAGLKAARLRRGQRLNVSRAW
jgi:hypothetical protein